MDNNNLAQELIGNDRALGVASLHRNANIGNTIGQTLKYSISAAFTFSLFTLASTTMRINDNYLYNRTSDWGNLNLPNNASLQTFLMFFSMVVSTVGVILAQPAVNQLGKETYHLTPANPTTFVSGLFKGMLPTYNQPTEALRTATDISVEAAQAADSQQAPHSESDTATAISVEAAQTADLQQDPHSESDPEQRNNILFKTVYKQLSQLAFISSNLFFCKTLSAMFAIIIAASVLSESINMNFSFTLAFSALAISIGAVLEAINTMLVEGCIKRCGYSSFSRT